MDGELLNQLIRKYIDYDPLTGNLLWKVSIGRHKKGTEAGSKSRKGKRYQTLHFKGRYYLAHRLAWFIAYGVWPSYQIDHINGDGFDNRIINLRDVPFHLNMHNKKKKRENISGFWKTPEGKYRSDKYLNGKRYYLGLFETKNEAIEAIISFKKVSGL